MSKPESQTADCPLGLRHPVRRLIEELSDQHGGDHHDDECPVCRAIQDVEGAMART